MLLYYVAGREHHATENERFAARLEEEGCEATVLAAQGKTHLSIELEIGLGGDVPTAEILETIGFSPDGKTLAFHSLENIVKPKRLDVTTCQFSVLGNRRPRETYCFAYTSDGRRKSQSDAPKKIAFEAEDLLAGDSLDAIASAQFAMRRRNN